MRLANKRDLTTISSKENLLGGPGFSLSALEILLCTEEFLVLVDGKGSGAVVSHEGVDGKDELLFMTGDVDEDAIVSVLIECCERGATEVTAWIGKDSPVLHTFHAIGFVAKGSAQNHFGMGMHAEFVEIECDKD